MCKTVHCVNDLIPDSSRYTIMAPDPEMGSSPDWLMPYLIAKGNAMHAVRSFECRPILRPYFWPFLTSFGFHTEVFLASYAFGIWHI